MNLDERESANKLSLQDQIELLVEGELTTQERSGLLLRIDAKPELWRQLALEFVAHQTIRESVRDACQTDVSMSPEVQESTASTPLQLGQQASDSASRWTTNLVMVGAALLIAFFAGKQYQYQVDGEQTRALSINSSRETEIETHSSRDGTPGTEGEQPADPDTKIVGHVRWLNSGGQELTPVFAGNRIDTDWLRSNPPRVDERMQRVMSRAGWEVIPNRKLVSLELPEVGQFMIPFDDVNYRFVGREVF